VSQNMFSLWTDETPNLESPSIFFGVNSRNYFYEPQQGDRRKVMAVPSTLTWPE